MAEDPQVVHRFEVDFEPYMVDVVAIEVSGLGYSVEVIDSDLTSGTMESPTQKLAGRRNWPDLVIKYQASSKTISVWEWRTLVDTDAMDSSRVNGSIMAMSRTGDVIAQWDVENAWASEVSGPEMDTTVSGIMYEQVKLVHEGIERVA